MKQPTTTIATTLLPRRVLRRARHRRFFPQSLSWALASAFSSGVTGALASLVASFAAPTAYAQSAAALPQGGVAVQGGAAFNYSGNRLDVTTTNGAGNRSAINWQSFNIGAGQTTHIAQPNAASSSLNRVVTNNPSAIYGTLSSNGNLILVNQNGIAVGRAAWSTRRALRPLR